MHVDLAPSASAVRRGARVIPGTVHKIDGVVYLGPFSADEWRKIIHLAGTLRETERARLELMHELDMYADDDPYIAPVRDVVNAYPDFDSILMMADSGPTLDEIERVEASFR